MMRGVPDFLSAISMACRQNLKWYFNRLHHKHSIDSTAQACGGGAGVAKLNSDEIYLKIERKMQK